MTKDSTQHIVSQYDDRVDLYRGLANKAKGLVEEILQGEGIRAHSVTSRVKERESLRKKIDDPNKSYAVLDDVTDIVGVRIITYFEDDVDRVAKHLESEFEIDWDNTVDKRKALGLDRFGYQTMQHIAELGSNRTVLMEYARFGKLKFEIQTRSILQHTWAEIEHDLGYKSQLQVPKDIRRRFSALAGLLEIADREFQSLREELDQYERDVPDRIEREPQLVEINKASLFAFVTNNRMVRTLDEEIVALVGGSIDSAPDFVKQSIQNEVAKLTPFRFKTVQDLEDLLIQNRRAILAFAGKWLKRLDNVEESYEVQAGISLFYLAYILAAQTSDVERIREFISNSSIIAPSVLDEYDVLDPDDLDEAVDQRADVLARRILTTYESILDEQQ